MNSYIVLTSTSTLSYIPLLAALQKPEGKPCDRFFKREKYPKYLGIDTYTCLGSWVRVDML